MTSPAPQQLTDRVEIRYSEPAHRPNRVVAIVSVDGHRLGHVVCRGNTYSAARRTGTLADLRRVGHGFRSAQTAAAWIAEAAVQARGAA